MGRVKGNLQVALGDLLNHLRDIRDPPPARVLQMDPEVYSNWTARFMRRSVKLHREARIVKVVIGSL